MSVPYDWSHDHELRRLLDPKWIERRRNHELRAQFYQLSATANDLAEEHRALYEALRPYWYEQQPMPMAEAIEKLLEERESMLTLKTGIEELLGDLEGDGSIPAAAARSVLQRIQTYLEPVSG